MSKEGYTDKCHLCWVDHQIHCRNGDPNEPYRLIYKPGFRRPLPASRKIEDCSKFQTNQLVQTIGRERLVFDPITI